MANKSGAWGIESVKFAPLVDSPTVKGNTSNPAKSAFPTSWEEFKLKAIVKDSLSFNDQAPSTNNIEVEDSDNYYAVLQSDAGSEGFTVQVYDMSKEAYMFFFGFKEGAASGADRTILSKTQSLSYKIMPCRLPQRVQMSSLRTSSSGRT